MSGWRRVYLALLALFALVLGGAGTAAADAGGGGETAAEREAAERLIETYAPRLMVRKQNNPPCDTNEEQYEATAVETVLGNPAVKLTREVPGTRQEEVVKAAPGVADIAGLGSEYHLNLPGEPLGDTCVYAKDFAKLLDEGRAPAVTYAHIAREQGREGLALQYWFFWYFNQFNDVHEGDWEGMQVVFRSSDPAQALREGPSEIALFQHAGGERADWDDGKVEKEGTHPVVYPAAGSHATFYEAAIYVENGRKGSGVGCDNTSAPLRRLEVRPIRVPTDPDPAGPHGWLTYEGRWGQLEASFNNGPTGPRMKESWTEPLTWMEGLRETSPRLPAGSVLGPTVTKAFCGAVAEVTSYLNHTQDSRWAVLALPALIVLLLGFIAWRTRWRPVDVEDLRQPRAFGQLLLTSGRLYHRHWRVFAPIGLTALPVVGGLTMVSWLLTGDTGRSLDDRLGRSGLHVALGEILVGIGQPIAQAIVAAAVIVAVRLLVVEGRSGFRSAYAGMWERFRRVVGAQLLATLAVIGMAVTVVGIPFAAWKYVSWLFVQQQILFEDRQVRPAFKASAGLVRGRWWYTLRVAGVLWLLGIAAGPVLGFALIFADLPLLLINLIGAVVFALMIPFVAIGQTLLFLDLEARGPVPEGSRRRWAWLPRRAAPERA